MSILSSISKGVSTFVSNAVSGVKSVEKAIVSEAKKETTAIFSSNNTYSSVVSPSAVVKAVAPVAEKVASSIVKTVSSNKLVTAAVVTGAIVETKAGKVGSDIKSITTIPSNYNTFTSDVAAFRQDPTLQSFETIVKDSPIISTGIALGTTATFGKTLSSGIPLLTTYITNQSLKDTQQSIDTNLLNKTNNLTSNNTDKVLTNQLIDDTKTNDKDLPKEKTKEKEKTTDTDKEVPVTPALVEVKETPAKSTKKRYHKKIKKQPNNNLRVNIYNQTKSLYIPYGNRLIHGRNNNKC